MTISLINCKKYYKDLPHQRAAIHYLFGAIAYMDYKAYGITYALDILKCSDKELNKLQNLLTPTVMENLTYIWRTELDTQALPESTDFPKELPYFTQLDNPIKPHASCNSSSHYMMAKSLKPGLPDDDSNYVRRVYSGEFGYKGYRNPSIYWDVHRVGLLSLGIKIKINSSGDFNKAVDQANKGILTPVNIRHRGNINAQDMNSGHVVCIAGSKAGKLLIHDPYGELNYITGKSDLSASGIYWVTRANFIKRWQGVFSQFIGFK